VDNLVEQTFLAEQRHFWFRGFRRFVSPLLKQATEGVREPRLLDCGCGTGANLSLLAKYGTPFGLERTWKGIQFGRSQGLKRLVQGTVAALPFKDETFDVAVSFDVLYCLEDDVERATISEMSRVVKAGGAAIVNVAALDILKGDHSVFGGEVRRYTRSGLEGKLEAAGFRVIRSTYTNAALFPVTASVRAYQRLRRVKREGELKGDFFVPPAPINSLFSAALAVEAGLITSGMNMPVGSSVLCFARKIT
jgi:ubiquinone/menaquinone biosynthesis C-methylase UbiE